jgi:nucleotide-binding universal stress UspA family protein
MYEKILIATDGSDLSKEAENQGLELAEKYGGSVTVLYVEDINIPPAMVGPYALAVEENVEEIQNLGKEIVEEVKEKGKKMGVTVTTMLLKGHPAEEIINQADKFDIVIVGSLGRSGLAHLLIGSVAEKVVRHSPVPVLVVKKQKDH